ncbi:type VII secretion integral membrane protein EccD [Nocardiopsis potens]|uniref:type VII secretion integral membrane protein EccD n=1 Tax=Nocardiopsis potens TaxID=1246458 RepID=UPI00034D022C|nr:type VII secretion integral membrane protein EccD [Nocardiopsis potens]
MTTWSRVTLVGERRRVDAVLPAEEPIGALMPDVLRMLGDAPDGPATPRHLSTVGGDLLDADATLADREVADGSVLRLVRADDPLPAPIVHEVPEAVGTALGEHPAYWSAGAARWTGTATLVALVLGIGFLVRGGAPGTAVAVLAGMGVLLTAGGAALGPAWREPLGTALTIAGGCTGVLAVWTAAGHHDWPGWAAWAGTAAVVSVLLALLGLTSPLGRGGVVGGATGAGLAALWAGCALFGLGLAETAAIAAVACTVLVSVLLRAALALSGLTVLDDRRGAGEEVPREDVRSALAGTHRGMVVAAVAVAACAVAAAYGLSSAPDPWTMVLTGLLAVILAGRSRMFPLVTEKAPLLAAAVAAVLALAWALDAAVPFAPLPSVGLLAAVLALPVVALAADPAEHTRAMLRRTASRIEAVAVVVCVPVAVGALGTYERLLATF